MVFTSQRFICYYIIYNYKGDDEYMKYIDSSQSKNSGENH